ncbi:hypothetical protein Q9189_005521 [Teloschistes chrysophthalmus]
MSLQPVHQIIFGDFNGLVALTELNSKLVWSSWLQLVRDCHTSSTLGSSSVKEVVGSCLAAAIELDFLKHAALGLAASHLVFLAGRHNLSMYYHIDRALYTFRRRLSSPITSREIDSLITSCVLLNAVAFSASNHGPSGSCTTEESGNLQWLTVQNGLKAILLHAKGSLNESSWVEVYKKDARSFRGQSHKPFEDNGIDLQDVSEILKNLCGIDDCSNANNNPYYSVLASLGPLLNDEHLDIPFTRTMGVMHRFRPEFHELLRAKDLRAMLLLAHWLGLLCTVNLWWVAGRARSECYACCSYLEANGDSAIRVLLSLPAQQCGYQLEEATVMCAS